MNVQCSFAHLDPCDGGRVGMTTDGSEEGTYAHCRRHYNRYVRKLRKAAHP